MGEMVATEPTRTTTRFSPFTKKSLIFIGIAAGTVLIFAFLQAVASVLLLLFAGILLAVFFNGLAGLVTRYSPLTHGWALALVLLALVGLFSIAVLLLAPKIASQIDQLTQTLPQSVKRLKQTVSQYQWGRSLLQEIPTVKSLSGSDNLWGRITGVFSTTVGILGNTLVIIVLGIYVGANPGVYTRGILLLVPVSKRDRALQILDTTGRALWKWLTGQLISMTIVGFLTWIGLLLLGIPLALTLGLIAGLFEFVPLLGPFVGAVPGILIALTAGPEQALYAGLVYLGVQQIESNLITPFVMKEAVSLPPALTVSATLLAGALFGMAGVLLATPLMVVAMVLVRAVYIHDILGDTSGKPF